MKTSFNRFLSYFDIPGGVVLGLFSLEMLALIAYCAITGKTVSPIHRDIYLGVVSAFALNKTVKVYRGQK